MSELVRDIQYALRQITNRKLFSGIVICLVALGIGANTVLFSFVDGLLLKTLPVRNPGNLFELQKKRPVEVRPDENFTYAEYQALKRSGMVFLSSVQAECPLGLQPIANGDEPRLGTVNAVSAALFKDLGLSPERGRLFADSEDSDNGLIPAILSYRFWKSGDVNALGHTIHVKGHPFTVVGVLPRGFHGLNLDSQPDVILPLSAVQFLSPYQLAGAQFNLYVRLRQGIPPTFAAERAGPLLREGIEESVRGHIPPKSQLEFKANLLPLEHGASQVRGLFANAVLLLMCGVILLLLIVSFNVGGLLLAKSQARRREFAIRRCLGASSFRVVRQVWTESFLLGVLGTLLGVCFAYALTPVLLRLVPVLRNPATQLVITPAIDLAPDWRTFLFVSSACLLSGMIFGMLPALAGLRFDLNHELKPTGSRTSRTASALVGLQVMLTVVLLSASVLMIRSYWNLLHAATGFDDDHVVSFRISPSTAGYQKEQIRSYYERLLQRVLELPRVRAASFVLYGVMREKGFGTVVAPTGQTRPPGTFLSASTNGISTGYFDTMGIQLIEGRDLRPDDGEMEQPPFPVVVDETFARTFFPGRDVIGHTFNQGPNGGVPATYRIVGLVATAKYRSLKEVPPPTFYSHPIWNSHVTGMLNFCVRTNGDPQSLIPQVRDRIRAVDPHVPIVEITTLKVEERNSVWQERMVVVMTGFFGIAGLLLAGVGLYGALTQFVVQQTRVIGICMALGAQVRHVVRAVCLAPIISVMVGLMAGFAVSVVVLRLTKAFLYGLSPFDPFSYLLAIGLILGVTLLAALMPLLRAVKLDSAAVLRSE